jgi:protein-L-isoaspartate(D-aspartate) O-methyltransferase
MSEWSTLAAALDEELIAAGKLRSPQWQAALRAVPRHELVPVHYTMDPHTGAWTAADTADDLPLVYSNTALFVLPEGRSSTSMPGLMTRMLETLDVRDGHRVLEIGAGTGYNAALLCHRLGEEHVFAVDIEPDLVGLARQRLARLGYHPTLVATDGVHGLPEHAPYHRIVATCAVPAVPWAWVEQTREDGLTLGADRVLVLRPPGGPTPRHHLQPARRGAAPTAPQHRAALFRRFLVRGPGRPRRRQPRGLGIWPPSPVAPHRRRPRPVAAARPTRVGALRPHRHR